MFKMNTRGVTLTTNHGTKLVQAILHPRPHNNRRKPVRISKYTLEALKYPKNCPSKRSTAPHVLVRRWCKRVYEQSNNAANRTRAYKMWKHYSATSRNYGA